MIQGNRVIVHLDVDAFYVGVERELRKEWKDVPLAVSQYNPYGNLADVGIDDPARILYNGRDTTQTPQQRKQHPNVNGSLIAVSYEARAKNVQRNDRGLVAIQKCPHDLVIVQVPVSHGKANLTLYRDASERLLSKLVDHIHQAIRELSEGILDGGDDSSNEATNQVAVEKASIDEVYLDLSKPVEAVLEKCRDTSSCWMQIYQRLMQKDGEMMVKTTIGGMESDAKGLATNSLSKEEIRKGSYLQVLDSGAMDGHDEAEKAWWQREQGSTMTDSGWSEKEVSLIIGAWMTLQARQSLTNEFEGVYTLSAGISTNKTMAKLASGLKKPNRQTLVNPDDQNTLQKLFHPLPLGRLRGLGGKFGDHVAATLQVQTVGELSQLPLSTLQSKIGEEKARWLHQMSQGNCTEPVKERTKAKRYGAGKTFRGKLAIRCNDDDNLQKWVGNLSAEVIERIKADPTRYPTTLTCWLHLGRDSSGGGSNGETKPERRSTSQSATVPHHMTHATCTQIALKLAKDIISRATFDGKRSSDELSKVSVIGMEISASNFVTMDATQNTIMNAFQKQKNRQRDGSGAEAKPSTSSSNTIPQPPSENVPNNQLPMSAEVNPDAGSSACDSTSNPTTKEDSDLEYARRLQESFDKEQKSFDAMEKRWSSLSSSSKRKPKESSKDSASQQSIASFFKKPRSK